jgi:tRNA A-37 threonylcarbamoyl transferase component Bud32
MSPEKTCPECGTELAPESLGGLCPRCLLRLGAQTADIGAPTASPGTRLRYVGDYELLGEIARGGMGVVYKARQVSLNRVVAVKMVLSASEEAVRRFIAEAEAAANLQHPNIVAIHEIGEHEGQYYFSMDYVEGPNLAELLADGPLTPERAARYLKTIAEALHFAHQRGTLHRDLKPQNILIDGEDRPRITDFGLARQVENAGAFTDTGKVVGTPAYMPPEQALGRLDRLGPHSDVYSLGAMLYELFTGRPPFQGGSPAAILLQTIEREPTRPRRLAANLPADAENICLKCLEKRPERRYPSAQALADDLGRLLEHRPVQARRAGLPRRLWSWSIHHPWAICAVVSVVFFGSAAATYGLWVQNGYLKWVQGHPDHTRAAGVRSAAAGGLLDLCLPLGLVLMLAWFDFIRRRCGMRWGQVFELGREPPPAGHAISSRVLWAYALLALFGIGCAMLTLKRSIEAHVWEGLDLMTDSVVLLLCFAGRTSVPLSKPGAGPPRVAEPRILGVGLYGGVEEM